MADPEPRLTRARLSDALRSVGSGRTVTCRRPGDGGNHLNRPTYHDCKGVVAMTHATEPGNGLNTTCPMCGKLAPDVKPYGDTGRLLCVCRPCDHMWWAA